MGTLNVGTLRILAADDSAVMRGIMRKLFLMHAENASSELPRMELCGVAEDGVQCLEAVTRLRPDVLVLDLEMPRLHGLDVLDRLRKESPELPVIMCSSYTEHGARATLEALARGASDYVMKPGKQSDFDSALQSLTQQLLPRIAALAKGQLAENSGNCQRSSSRLTHRTHATSSHEPSNAQIEVVVIGLATGGPSALEQWLPRLPLDFPVAVLIVQHMPKLFTGALADRLDKCCALQARQAYVGAIIRPGTIWLAPGDAHMEVAQFRRPGIDYATSELRAGRVRLHQQEPLNHCRPSVDYLFHSAARVYGSGALALVMTGMGADGLGGARAVHEVGGVVL